MLRRFALSMFLAALACREPPPPRVVAAAPRPGVFLGADLAAAAELDARLARLSALAAEFEVALLHEGGARLDRSARRLEPLLDAASAEVDRALDGVRDPRDRELAAPLVAAARRWPQLLRDVRAEIRAGPGRTGPAARALDDNAVEVARRLDASKKGPDGTLSITFPMGDKQLSGIAAEDIGKCALGIFKKGRENIGKTVGIAGEHLICSQMAATLTRELNQEVHYNDVPPEVYRGFDFPHADDIGNMFQFFRDFASYFCGARSTDVTRGLNPALQCFEGWLAQHKSQIPLE